MKQFGLVLGLVLNDFGAHLPFDLNLVPVHLRLDLEVSLKSLLPEILEKSVTVTVWAVISGHAADNSPSVNPLSNDDRRSSTTLLRSQLSRISRCLSFNVEYSSLEVKVNPGKTGFFLLMFRDSE